MKTLDEAIKASVLRPFDQLPKGGSISDTMHVEGVSLCQLTDECMDSDLADIYLRASLDGLMVEASDDLPREFLDLLRKHNVVHQFIRCFGNNMLAAGVRIGIEMEKP